jgi:7-keto-8-aminopelargonate synthetase-like enzyme
MFENRVLRRIFAPKRGKAAVEWRKLHNEELSALYSSPNIIQVIKSRRIRWAEQAAHMWERRGVYMALVRKPEKKRPTGRPRRRWEYNIKMELQDVVRGYGLD